jgi:mRNA deadenylase 3'-5' endonuclease subunit Ccr4
MTDASCLSYSFSNLQVPQLESSLDWLFASASLAVTALLWPLDPALPADRRLPHSRTGLPNAQHPSDHLPIGAKLRCLPAGVMLQQQEQHVE